MHFRRVPTQGRGFRELLAAERALEDPGFIDVSEEVLEAAVFPNPLEENIEFVVQEGVDCLNDGDQIAVGGRTLLEINFMGTWEK